MVSIICVNTPVGGLRARTTGTTGNTVAGLHLFHPLLLGRYSHITCSTEGTVALLSHQLTLSARTGRTDNTAQQQQYSLQELSKIRLKVRGCDLHFLCNFIQKIFYENRTWFLFQSFEDVRKGTLVIINTPASRKLIELRIENIKIIF